MTTALASPDIGVAANHGLLRALGLQFVLLALAVLVVSAVADRLDRTVTAGVLGGGLFLASSALVFSNRTVRESVVSVAVATLVSVSVWVVVVSMNDIIGPDDAA